MAARYIGIAVFLACLIVFAAGQNYYTSDEIEDGVEDVELTGDHVCNRQVYVTEYVTRNVSYTCWQSTKVRCSGDYDWYDRYGDCYRNTRSTCYDTYVECVGRWKDIDVCCRGYEHDGYGKCKEIIMCGENNGGCSQKCAINTDGTHKCVCNPGYRLEDDGKTCQDLDECTDTTKPNACINGTCHNLDGSFFCSCRNGYRLIKPHECIEVNECLTGNGGCEHKCINTNGAFYCECHPGFMLMEGFMCKDKDECELHNGGCSHTCKNHISGYTCKCPEGWGLMDDDKTCVDKRPTTKSPGDNGGGAGSLTTTVPVPPPGVVTAKQIVDGNEGPRREMEMSAGANGALIGGIMGGLLALAALIGLMVMAIILIKRFRNKPHGASAVENNMYGVNQQQQIHPSDPPPAYDNPAFVTPNILDKKKPFDNSIYDNPAVPQYDNPANVQKGQYDNNANENQYDNTPQIENVYEQPMPRPVGIDGVANPGYDVPLPSPTAPLSESPQNESFLHGNVYQDPAEAGSSQLTEQVNHYEDVAELRANFGKEVV